MAGGTQAVGKPTAIRFRGELRDGCSWNTLGAQSMSEASRFLIRVAGLPPRERGGEPRAGLLAPSLKSKVGDTVLMEHAHDP